MGLAAGHQYASDGHLRHFESGLVKGFRLAPRPSCGLGLEWSSAAGGLGGGGVGEEGIFCGISAGGALVVALRVARQVENATIAFIVCDRGDRYLSTGVFPA